MNVRQIEHFVAIVEHGGYHAAANHLGVTQPALTKSIAGLEADLGATLLTRARGKTTDVTVFGRLIYERGLKLLEDMAETRRALELLRDGYTGEVRIGFGIVLSAHRIAHIASTVQARLPKSMIVVRTGFQHELIPRLRARQLDFLVLSGLNPDSYADLSTVQLWRDPFKVFMGPTHPLRRYRIYDRDWARSWAWLSSERLVSTDDQAARFLGHSPRTVAPSRFDVFDPAIIAEILRRQPYLSAWPSLSFEAELDAGLLHGMDIPPVDGRTWESQTLLIRPRGVLMAPAVQSAWRAVQGMAFAQASSQDG
jgi:DNA-binding transcriptional LysR family regulator